MRARADRDEDLRDREVEVERDLTQDLERDDDRGQVQPGVLERRQDDRVPERSGCSGHAAVIILLWQVSVVLGVVGSLSLDLVDGGPPRPGGAVFYAAQALRLLGARPGSWRSALLPTASSSAWTPSGCPP